MATPRILKFSGAFLAVLMITAGSSNAAGERIDWSVIGSGATSGSSTSFRLQGTVGQTAVGVGTSASYQLLSGFWQDFGSGGCCIGITGDVNDDSFDADVADVVYMVEFSFGSPAGPAPICAEEGDLNGDTFSADVADIVYAVEFSFSSPAGPAPLPCP